MTVQLETSNFMLDAMLFVTVLDCSSFTAAGEQLGISKSIVSKRIRRLETQLKLQLLHRSTRRLTPTEAGTNLYNEFSHLRTKINNIQSGISKHQEQPRGTLRLHSPISFGIIQLAPAIKLFCEKYPEIKIEMFLGKQFDNVIEQRMDLSIHIGPIKDSNLYAKRLMQSKLVACASPEYLEQNGYPKDPEDLLQHNCLRYHHPTIGNEWYFKQNHTATPIKINGNFSASSANTLEAAALAGQGITLLPNYVIEKKVKQGRLLRLLQDYCASHVDIFAVYSDRHNMPPKQRALLNFLSHHFA
ncbi:MAG: LysR family transcriptional regulator [Coxiellaceae bacterium]|nr:LysR family transcriptional regulator [Coxiellaceae bacterium]